MLFTSGKSQHTHLTQSVFEFFTTKYRVDSDVEVYHTDLSDDNAFGFTEVNGDEQFIQIHNKLSEKDYVELEKELIQLGIPINRCCSPSENASPICIVP